MLRVLGNRQLAALSLPLPLTLSLSVAGKSCMCEESRRINCQLAQAGRASLLTAFKLIYCLYILTPPPPPTPFPLPYHTRPQQQTRLHTYFRCFLSLSLSVSISGSTSGPTWQMAANRLPFRGQRVDNTMQELCVRERERGEIERKRYRGTRGGSIFFIDIFHYLFIWHFLQAEQEDCVNWKQKPKQTVRQTDRQTRQKEDIWK